MLFRDRGKGLENALDEELRQYNPSINTFEKLIVYFKRHNINAQTVYKTFQSMLLERSKWVQFGVCHHRNHAEINIFLGSVKKYGALKVFNNKDPDEALAALEVNTLYRKPKSIKRFQTDLTTMRAAIGTKQKYDGSYGEKQQAVYRARAAKKKFKGKR
jgi:hypothetical protein|tara:strand:+ start:2663 stop:3139 length:477 start_codon:yes stop_codon:yes gene_type:complete